MKKFLSSAALSLGLTLVPAYVATVQAETLSDAFISAYRNSSLLDKQRATLRAADEGVAQAFATLRPSILRRPRAMRGVRPAAMVPSAKG